jgi:AcrR family transcriptional regulator
MSAKPAAAAKDKAGSPRERILHSAVELLAVRGFEAMTMRMLGDAVGLDNSSLYRHFASKAELADAVLDHVAGDFLSAIEGRLDPPATLDALEALAAAAGAYFFERQAAARVMMHWLMSMGPDAPFDVSVPATDAGRPGGRLLELLRQWLAAGVRRGALRKHAMPDAVVMLLGVTLLRPATFGHLLASTEPKRSRAAAAKAFEAELRAVVRGAFTP